jgi:hypothetical protein
MIRISGTEHGLVQMLRLLYELVPFVAVGPKFLEGDGRKLCARLLCMEGQITYRQCDPRHSYSPLFNLSIS